MRNLSKIVCIASLIILASGCSSKEYTCTKVEEENNIETTTTVLIKKDGLDTNIKVETEAETEDKAKSVEEALNKTNLYTKITRNGKKITAEYSKFYEGKTGDKNKKELEDDGYTCK